MDLGPDNILFLLAPSAERKADYLTDPLFYR